MSVLARCASRGTSVRPPLPDDMPEAYARHLAQQREDARAMEATNTLNRAKRGIVHGYEYEGKAARG
eukprot:6695543-Alexandrium_andersonii.AAC.1